MAEEELIPSDFLQEIFRLSLHDQYIQQICASKLQQNWLPTEQEKSFLTEFKYQIDIEQKKPTFGSLLLAAKSNKNKELQEYIAILRETQLADPDTIIKSLESFIKQAMFLENYEKVANLYNGKKKKAAYKEYTKGAEAIEQFSLTTDLFEPIFGNFPKRHAKRVIENSKGHSRMATGIDELDFRLNGGPEKKELMCFMAQAKAGKSFCLTHMGVNYARRGYGVAHFQLEGTKKQCNNRYDANWSGSLYQDIKAGQLAEDKFKSYRKIIDNIGKGEIFVYAPEKFGAMNVLDIRRMLIDLKKKREIDVVIIDYVDLLNPDSQNYKIGDERHRQEMTMRMLKELAMELDILIITATQTSNIESDLLEDPDFVIRKEYLAESKGKVRPVDFLISINRTREERKIQVCRLFLDSVRDHEGEEVITIVQNLKRSRFYDRKATILAGLVFSEN